VGQAKMSQKILELLEKKQKIFETAWDKGSRWEKSNIARVNKGKMVLLRRLIWCIWRIGGKAKRSHRRTEKVTLRHIIPCGVYRRPFY